MSTSSRSNEALHSCSNQEMNQLLSGNLQNDTLQLKRIFDRSSDIVFRELRVEGFFSGVLVFLDGLVNQELIDTNVVKPLSELPLSGLKPPNENLNELEDFLKNQIITTLQISTGQYVYEVIEHILLGDTALIINGAKQALFISASQWDKRSVEEPATEAVIRGPRDGFTESIRTNTVMIRRRLKTPQLKMEALKIGKLSKTEIVIVYLDEIAEETTVNEIRKRLEQIDIDAILESGYIEELIEDHPYSIFPQVLSTERPDRVAACLLEGKVGILIDNTPFALVVPVTFFEMMQASEDYYQRYFFATATRFLRYWLVFIALTFPSIYIAITTYHQEMIPTSLLLSIANARESVPFPAIIEALLMELAFEGLREAGIRLPRPVGQAVSIVGALVIGQAAVQAGIVSTPLVIVVSFTGIASFILPSYSQGFAIRLLRFPLMIISGVLGLFGVLLGLLAIMIHLTRLRSFGVPYLSPIAPMHPSDLKDTVIRVPWWNMKKRPVETGHRNPIRMRHMRSSKTGR